MEMTKHAKKRMEQRNISLNTVCLKQLGLMVNKAFKKGSREALLLIDNIAFIVNIKNNKVITVLNKDEMNEKVITNVDSVVFA
ncbi:hypothetical protein KAJ27_06205 [bacterium]|nr:hypothetical protein [bacterium]